MNCYAGLAKRIAKSCFPRAIPVPQLQPLDARKIFYASDEEVWKATLVWAEERAQEREAAALKAVSETDTESYDSDDSEVGVQIQPISLIKPSLFGDDEDEAPAPRNTMDAERRERDAKNRYASWVADVMVGVNIKAAIIQAAARGRALRAWKAQFTNELAREMSHIWRARYHARIGMDAVEQQLAEQWMVSPKCVKAWILQGEQRAKACVRIAAA